MDKIICLVGESGSGKTTLCKELEKEGYNIIKSYTTRKPRSKDEYGHTFVNYEDFFNATLENNWIAYTFFDKEHYWATKEQYQDKQISIYVIDPAGAKDLKERVKDAEIIVIYLATSRVCRVSRMLIRAGYGMCVPTPRSIYNPIAERATHDDKAFLEFKLEKQYDYLVNGQNDIEEVLKDVKLIIGKYEP